MGENVDGANWQENEKALDIYIHLPLFLSISDSV
jgi:hypothetical protein